MQYVGDTQVYLTGCRPIGNSDEARINTIQRNERIHVGSLSKLSVYLSVCRL